MAVVTKWADTADVLLAHVIPASVTAGTARIAFIASLAGLNYTSDGFTLLQASFQNYAIELAVGMTPTGWIGTPPPAPPNFNLSGHNDANVAADIISGILVTWAMTGKATLAVPPNTVMNWV
jgi:hypothetical protein